MTRHRVADLSQIVTTETGGVGPQHPVAGSPARRPGTARRSSSVDVTRPEGAGGPVEIDARARDAVVGPDGAPSIADTMRLAVTLAPTREVVAIAAASGTSAPSLASRASSDASATDDVPAAGLAALRGRNVGSGFRAAVAAALPEARRDAGLLYLLLDDLPVATLVSGYALQHAGLVPAVPRAAYQPTVDLCSGWRAGGTLMQVLDATGTVPMTLGPRAPELERRDDPAGWHRLPEPALRSVRRRRRIDIVPADTRDRDTRGGDAGTLVVDAMFRDSHFDAEGVETVVHEYSLTGRVDAATLVVTELSAVAHVLPYVECPAAAASAARLVGMPLGEVRDRVRAELVGISTCTHLNDLLRSVADVQGLWRAYRDTVTASPP
jgi:hypothetical protein